MKRNNAVKMFALGAAILGVILSGTMAATTLAASERNPVKKDKYFDDMNRRVLAANDAHRATRAVRSELDEHLAAAPIDGDIENALIGVGVAGLTLAGPVMRVVQIPYEVAIALSYDQFSNGLDALWRNRDPGPLSESVLMTIVLPQLGAAKSAAYWGSQKMKEASQRRAAYQAKKSRLEDRLKAAEARSAAFQADSDSFYETVYDAERRHYADVENMLARAYRDGQNDWFWKLGQTGYMVKSGERTRTSGSSAAEAPSASSPPPAPPPMPSIPPEFMPRPDLGPGPVRYLD